MADDVFGIVGTTQAGAYKVESVAAEGGFGVIYRAHHEAFRAPVALKCLKIPGTMGAKAQAEFLERFREEAEVMFRLSASIPAVVRPLHVDVLSTPGGAFVPFMALEWLEGETLDVAVMRRRAQGRPPLSLEKLVCMLAPIARALERAHNFPTAEGTVSIAHRDLKPDNIFLATINGEEIAKLLDFGIAKVRSTAERIAGRISQNEVAKSSFTPGYAAPEQWQPKRFGQTGPWTDVWGLALVVVEAAVARPIIDGDNASMMGTATDLQRRPTPRTEGLRVSDDVEAVFRRALAVDPRERQKDAGIFWDELERALGVPRTTAPVLFESKRSSFTPPLPARGRDSAVPSVPDLMPPAAVAPPPRPAHSARLPPAVAEFGEPPPPALSPPGSDLLEFGEAPPPPSTLDLPARARAVRQSYGGELEIADVPAGDLGLELEVEVRPRPAARPFAASPLAGERAPLSGSKPRVVEPPSSSPQLDLRTRLAGPLRLAVGGIVVAAADQLLAGILGEPLALGPIRLTWVAGAVAIIGTALVLFRLFWPSEE